MRTENALFVINEVTPRERRVSRNFPSESFQRIFSVTPRERRVSRNSINTLPTLHDRRHASREACE